MRQLVSVAFVWIAVLVGCARSGSRVVEHQPMARVVVSTVSVDVTAGDGGISTGDLESLEKITRSELQDRRIVVTPPPGDITLHVELHITRRGSRLGENDHAEVWARVNVTRRDRPIPIATFDIVATSKYAARENLDHEVELAFTVLAQRLASYIAARIDRPANAAATFRRALRSGAA